MTRFPVLNVASIDRAEGFPQSRASRLRGGAPPVACLGPLLLGEVTLAAVAVDSHTGRVTFTKARGRRA